MNNFFSNILIKSLLVVFVFAAAMTTTAQEWSGPASSPDALNFSIPINVGAVMQAKSGKLNLGGLVLRENFLFTGAGQQGNIFVSDPAGNAAWAPAPSGSGAPTGGGTANRLAKWTSATALGDSQIIDDGTRVGIGATNASYKLNVPGNARAAELCLPAGTNGGCRNVWPTGSGMTNPMDTIGDMIYRAANGNPTKLPIGSLGQVLKVAGGIPAWSTPSAGGGPWVKNGNNIYLADYQTNDFKVGIGTNTPSQQLEITQNFRIPFTTATSGTATAGAIFTGGDRFLHTFGGNAQNNLFLGKNAGNFSMNTTGATAANGNTGIGAGALNALTSGKENTAVGSLALNKTTTGSRNTAVGYKALELNISGEDNTALGAYALSKNISGNRNTAIGYNALLNNTSGSNNTAVGYGALATNTVGSNNTAIGAGADVLYNNLTNATAIGAGAKVEASNTMVFGNSAVKFWGFGGETSDSGWVMRWCDLSFCTIGSTGGAQLATNGFWSGSSDIAYKYDISDIGYGLDTILSLRPVSFKWNITDVEDIGFIAQEVESIIPEIVSGEDGGKTMAYSQLTAVLTKGVQEIDAEQGDISGRLDALEERLNIKR